VLWLGQGLSQVDTQITVVALPLLAVVTLGGTPLQVRGLVAVEYLPSLMLGLLAGLLVDRMERRSVMLVGDFGRFLLLATVAGTALADVFDFPLLYVLIALVGVLTLCYDVAYQSGLPSLVHEDHLLASQHPAAKHPGGGLPRGPGSGWCTRTGRQRVGTGVTTVRLCWSRSLERWREVLADDPEVAERVSDSSFPLAPGAVLDGDDDRSAAFDHGGTDRG